MRWRRTIETLVISRNVLSTSKYHKPYPVFPTEEINDDLKITFWLKISHGIDQLSFVKVYYLFCYHNFQFSVASRAAKKKKKKKSRI